ncbi:hypothetical protein GMORB2_0317 [Geosmithia morbida]|uniref:Uncharacterized protein n=1 Tax=Geosmithia morbida TaxID=1094350 RepID=A0A9P4Z306_9HYPO|nr:uncharacterized protein GMORB2_0317 [Geosmithia morbida]KAF4126581.1 hypothetical protein GMORB2_0317 [Geosmithia morbida]
MSSVTDEYLDGQLTDNEDVFPCKGCGEILEEGKAFELAGNRWHLDCFRCNSCGTLLDSDANLLLLGDGSLICNNCTYTCSACNNKIEDLAILTGDQAFCSTCFRCRNCKRKIDNLRYARTSQGIFCMQCHETLMARRRKKSKAAAANKSRDLTAQLPVITEKSLPALPPNVIPNNAFSDERVDPEPDTPTDISPRPRGSHRHTDSRGPSARSPERQQRSEGLGLSHARNDQGSTVVGNDSSGDDGFFIPVALDPSPAPSHTATMGDSSRKEQLLPKSSFADKRSDSRTSTPHIAFQENGRQHSDHSLKQSGSLTRSLSKQSKGSQKSKQSPDDHRSQDVSAVKKSGVSPSDSSSSSQVESRKTSDDTTPQESRRESGGATSKSTPRPENTRAIQRKQLPKDSPTAAVMAEQSNSGSFMQPRAAPAAPVANNNANSNSNKKEAADGSEPKTSPKLPRWSSGGDFTLDEDMARIMGSDQTSSFMMKRASNATRHGRTASVESAAAHPSRSGHSRSVSDTAGSSVSAQWPELGTADVDMDEESDQVPEMATPVSTSPDEDPAVLRRQLRSSEQRVADLERQFNSEHDLKNLNKKLIEKRKTVSVLDTQTEIMIRQLEVLAGYVEKGKDTKAPLDPRQLEESAIKEFVQKLESVQVSLSEEIEQLHEERDRLLEEKNNALADRDRALVEFEQLSSKNAQLADMNNDLTHQLQERFKNSSIDPRALNGLGIYSEGKHGTASSINLDSSSTTTGPTLVAADEDGYVESGPTVVQVRKGQVKKFNWKKGSKGLAQNVAKGVNRAVVAFQQNDRGERIPATMSGGDIGMPYNTTVTAIEAPPLNMGQTPQSNSANNIHGGVVVNGYNNQALKPGEHGRQGFGFFSKKHTMPKSPSAMNVTTAPATADASTTLFGSDLTERADFERRQIPSVVTRCIEEVELRGMNQEGIYRKTGGNSQVNAIKEGFNKDEDFDISDPDMDITAVTSVLKQYFRKLPTPLLTYDVYDRVLESNGDIVGVADETERCNHLRRTFATLPERHRDCLEFLMFHLDRVAQRQSENLMTPKNLAVVFAPTLMFDRSIEREMTDMHAKNLAVQFVIENSRVIFSEA